MFRNKFLIAKSVLKQYSYKDSIYKYQQIFIYKLMHVCEKISQLDRGERLKYFLYQNTSNFFLFLLFFIYLLLICFSYKRKKESIKNEGEGSEPKAKQKSKVNYLLKEIDFLLKQLVGCQQI
ncbi:hypothetical protein ABPG72_010010 [Tetrahymena utriculariae]